MNEIIDFEKPIYSQTKKIDFSKVIKLAGIKSVQKIMQRLINDAKSDSEAYKIVEKWYNAVVACYLLYEIEHEKHFDKYHNLVVEMNNILNELLPPLNDWYSYMGNQIKIIDYIFYNFKGKCFRKEKYFQSYIIESIDTYIDFMQSKGENPDMEYFKQYQTKNGKVDIALFGEENLYVELKIGLITRQAVNQIAGYIEKTKIKGVIIGSAITPNALKLAEKNKISVYQYNLLKIAPTLVSYQLVAGKPVKSIEAFGFSEFFISEYESFVRIWGWPSLLMEANQVQANVL